jgi:hypothetical protein
MTQIARKLDSLDFKLDVSYNLQDAPVGSRRDSPGQLCPHRWRWTCWSYLSKYSCLLWHQICSHRAQPNHDAVLYFKYPADYKIIAN